MHIFHGTVGPPELHAQVDFRLTHRYIRIDDQSGFRGLDLAQLDGTVLALDWVVGKTHHIWGSAVMVAPGVALTARHVVDHMRNEGFLGEEVGGYLLAIGFHNDGTAIWNPNNYYFGDGDLAILTLVRIPQNASRDLAPTVNVATLVARQPLMGETISLIGFVAPERGEFENDAALDLLGSVGPVIDLYPNGRGRSRPVPSAGVLAKIINGMSGGAALDAQGRLLGIITSGLDEEPSFISLSWPILFTPIEVAWPPGHFPEPTTLHAMAQLGFCRIECIEALRSHVNESGEPLGVSLIL